jgi:hypothetical protein
MKLSEKEKLINSFMLKVDASYRYNTANERSNIVSELYAIAGCNEPEKKVLTKETGGINKYFEDLEKWENSFYCTECGNDDKKEFIYERGVANEHFV